MKNKFCKVHFTNQVRKHFSNSDFVRRSLSLIPYLKRCKAIKYIEIVENQYIVIIFNDNQQLYMLTYTDRIYVYKKGKPTIYKHEEIKKFIESIK